MLHLFIQCMAMVLWQKTKYWVGGDTIRNTALPVLKNDMGDRKTTRSLHSSLLLHNGDRSRFIFTFCDIDGQNLFSHPKCSFDIRFVNYCLSPHLHVILYETVLY